MINDYEQYIDFIKFQFETLVANDTDFEGIQLYISNEQQFEKYKDRKPNTIYLTIRFYPATVNFGASTLPFSITGLTERNKVELAQKLLLKYCETYNLTEVDGNIQVYQAPAIQSNFNEVYDGFRSVISMNGTLIIGQDMNDITMYYNYTDSDNVAHSDLVETITINPVFNFALDTQPYTSNNNNTKSIGKYSTLTIAFTTYFKNTELSKKLLDIALRNNSTDVNASVNLTIDFGYLTTTRNFKVVVISMSKDVGNLPYLAVTITE